MAAAGETKYRGVPNSEFVQKILGENSKYNSPPWDFGLWTTGF